MNRTKLIQVRVSEEEKLVIWKASQKADLDPSSWIRSTLLQKAKQDG